MMSVATDMQFGQAQKKQVRRFDRGAWFTLAAGLGWMTLFLGVVLARYSVPTDGWWTERVALESGADTYRLIINQTGRPSPIQAGDVVLAVNGRGPETFLPVVGPLVSANEPITLTLRRGEAIIDVTPPLLPRRPAGILQVTAQRTRDNPLVIPTTLAFMAIAAFVFLKRPDDLGSRYLFLLGCFFTSTLWGWADGPLLFGLLPPLQLWLAGWLQAAWAFLFLPTLILFVLVFPQPVWPATRWPRLTPLLVYGLPLGVIVGATIPYARSRDPVDLSITQNIAVGTLVTVLALFLGTLVVTLIYRFRTTRDALQHAQLRWLAFGLVMGMGGMTALALLLVVLGPTSVVGDYDINRLMSQIVATFMLLLPLCIGIAILRYRLFDIDVIIRKTLQYTIVSGLLALVYFGSVVVLEGIFRQLTGQHSTPAIVLSTLAIAALFNPLRRRVQTAVDRRFFRRKYDAEQVLDRFAATVRDETDLDVLLAELVSVIRETMQPEAVSVWLNPDTGQDKLPDKWQDAEDAS